MNDTSRVTMVKAGAIISLITGILFCITIVGLVFGIFNIIAYSRLKSIYSRPVNEAIDDINKSKYFGWAIYVLILCFPLGLFAFLPYILTDNTNINNVNTSSNSTNSNDNNQ